MALVVEDGTRPSGANSYISVSDARAYATARGLTFPADTVLGNAEAETLLITAMDLLESYRSRYKGTKVTRDQALQWPRYGVEDVDGYAYDSDEIPDILTMAQAKLAIDAQTVELQPNSDGRAVVREKVEGAVEVQYADSGDNCPQPVFAAAEALLAPLLRSGGTIAGASLSVVRV